MTGIAIQSPIPAFKETDGSPLNAGFLYFGEPNKNPEISPAPVFWDVDLTQPAAQPIRTMGGYPVRNGTPSNVYISGAFSITVKNKNGLTIFGLADASAFDMNLSARQKLQELQKPEEDKGDALLAVKQPFYGAVPSTQHAKNRERISVEDFGAVSFSETQMLAVTDASSLNDVAAKNFLAFNYAIAAVVSLGGGRLYCEGEIYPISGDGLKLPWEVELVGAGVGEWDGVYRADVKTFTGTTLLFKGAGTKQYEVKGITSRPNDGGKVTDPNDSSVVFRLSSFMNTDAVGATPATSKKFSAAISPAYPDRSKGVRMRDLRLCPWVGVNGIGKYIDYSATNYALADDWDVGILLNDVEASYLDNVQCVGHWRLAAVANTSSGWFYYGQSERNVFRECIFQGKVGFLLRHGDQLSIVDAGYDATNGNFVAIQWFSEHFFEQSGRFVFAGTVYTWSGLVFNSANNRLVFQNIKKLSDGSDVSTTGFTYMRPGYGTSGSAGTELSNVRMFGFDHSNGNLLRIHDIYSQNGLGSDVMSTPLEISGYPCRGIQMYNTKCQSAERVTAWLHDCADLHGYGFQVEGLAIYNCYAIAKGSAYSDVRDGGCEKLKLFGFVPDTSGVKYSLWSPIKAQIYGDNGWSGGIPIDFGGTGGTSAKSAKSNLNLMRYLTIPAGGSSTLAFGADLYAFQMTVSTNAQSVGGALLCGRAASGSFATVIAASAGNLITTNLGTSARLNIGASAGGNITLENLTGLTLVVIVSLAVDA